MNTFLTAPIPQACIHFGFSVFSNPRHCTLSTSEIRRDVTRGRLCASLRVILTRACFAAIPHTTRGFYGKLPQMSNDITSQSRS